MTDKTKKILIYVSVFALLMAELVFGFLEILPQGFFFGNKEQKGLNLGAGAGFISEPITNFLENALNFVEDFASTTETYLENAYHIKDYTAIRDKLLQDKIDFIEIHLEQDKIRVYKNREIVKQADILLKGDPYEWGGTSAGLYKIESGNRIGFSVVADVYLPYSLKFYGKYYIHGEPYYKGGEKLVSEATGGCLRLKDKDAKDIYEMAEIGMPVLVIDKENDNYVYKFKPKQPNLNITAKSWLVADLDSGFVITQKDSRQKREIASITKLMTATVIAENVDLRKSVTITQKILDAGWGTTDVIEKDKSYKVVELFYPALVESSNDSAEALSYFLGRTRTVEMMNDKTKPMLMPDTIFDCPTGYSPKNVSTAQDLFYLARYVLNNRPLLLQITAGDIVKSFGDVSFDPNKLWNKNVFSDDDTFLGGKTGFIKTSLYNGLFIFKFKDEQNIERRVAIILLGSDCLECIKTDTQKLYLYLMKTYFPNTLTP